ncbi:UNVERIFIED_CONTAM: hypothetical protein K2H54_003032 [Gekko kuhli]
MERKEVGKPLWKAPFSLGPRIHGLKWPLVTVAQTTPPKLQVIQCFSMKQQHTTHTGRAQVPVPLCAQWGFCRQSLFPRGPEGSMGSGKESVEKHPSFSLD